MCRYMCRDLLFVLEKAKERTFGIDGHMKVDIFSIMILAT